MDSSKAVINTAEAGGPSTISVVVTTVTTPASLTTCESPANIDSARRRVSPIKLVGLGGLERQNYCCGHWFPSSKSYHRHLAEKAVLDLTHEMKLIERGMLRCVHCSMWVHVDSMNGHLRKSHGIVKVTKTSKMVPSNAAAERTLNNRDALKTATNFVIKVSGQSAVRTSNGDISNSNINTMAKSGTVKLVTTSSGSLYHKVHQFHHSGTPGMGKVIVHQSTSNSLPVVNMGSRIVMKSMGSRNVIPFSNARQILPLPSGSQTVPMGTTTTAVTAATETLNINGITTVQFPGGNLPPSCSMSQNVVAPNTVETQGKIKKINGQNLKLIKKIANVKSKNKLLDLSKSKLLDLSKNKLVDLQPADCSASTALSLCTKTKEKGKNVSSGETEVLKPSQTKKSRKQVLKPNLPDMNCVSETPPYLNVKLKKKGRKRSVELGELDTAETNGSSPTLNHKGYRRKLKDTPDNENYTPKTTKQSSKNVGRGWRKKKRGPGRPRKVRLDETPDLSEIDSLFDEVNKEDLENEPIVKTKKEEENVPTVELDLFTLPSLNEQMSVLLTEPHNPNFKVYASMDAIFVGDSALGDVTNQIGYVTDANNVVYVNPGHFLFPNVEDLENFVPSPILTVKGSKVGFTPARQMWKLNSNKALTPVVLRENKFVNLSTSKEPSSCGVSSEKMSIDEKESQLFSVTQKQRVSEKVLKYTNVETNQSDKIIHVKPLRIAKAADTRQSNEYIRRDCVPSTSQSDAGGTIPLSLHKGPSLYDAEANTVSPKVEDIKTQRRQSTSQVDKEDQKKDKICSPESLLESIEGDISAVAKSSIEQNQEMENSHHFWLQNDSIAPQEAELHDLKSPVKLREASVRSSEVTENLKSPVLKNCEKATEEEEIAKSVSPCKYDSENSTKLDRYICVSPFKFENDTFDSKGSPELEKPCVLSLKSKNLQGVSPKETEGAASPVDCKNKPVLSPGSRVNGDSCTARLEKEPITLQMHVPETTKFTPKKSLSLSRRGRRRRSRTKSAEVVANATEDTEKDGELDFNDGFRYHSRRKARQMSESSVILKETRLDGEDRLSITDLREKLRMERLPARFRRQSGKNATEIKGIVNKSDVNSLIDQKSYPVTPRITKLTLVSTDNSAVQSDSLKGKTLSPLETLCQVTPSGLQDEAKSKTSVKRGRRRRRNSKLIESLDVAPLEANIAPDAVVRTPSLENINEKCIRERLIDQENADETISERKRSPSSKSIENMSTLSHSPKRVSLRNDAEQRTCTYRVDEPTVVKLQPDADVEKPSLPDISNVSLSTLLEKSKEGSPSHKENKKSKSPKREESSVVSPLRENDFSPLREWHGRGAKLKAQVLIQDQQAGVTDSQIIPSSSDISTHSRDTTPAVINSVCSSSPKKISSNSETQMTPTHQQAKTLNITKSPTSPKASKSPRSPNSVQDREWQARGAKLKAQVMISDQQRNVEEFSEISSQDSYGLTSPPAKKMKAEISPGTTRDIRTYFTVKNSPVYKTEDEWQLSSVSQAQTLPIPCKKKMNKYSGVKNDIRTYLSDASGKRKPLYSPQKSSSKVVKIEETSSATSPKRVPKKQNIKSVLQLRKEFELLENRVPQVSDSPLPSASCDFEGFDRCSRQSGLRSKSLMRLVSLMNTKRWYHLGKYPFPVDQLCDWDDEMLTSMIFDSD